MKNNIFKRVEGFILAVMILLLMVCIMPVRAGAEDSDEGVSGTLGNITWYVVNDSGFMSLNIEGDGAIPSRSELGIELYPWEELDIRYQDMKICENITYIPADFCRFKAVNINLPISLERIASGAFTNSILVLFINTYNVDCVIEENAFELSENVSSNFFILNPSTFYQYAKENDLNIWVLETFTEEANLKYEIYDDYAVVTGCEGQCVYANIPSEVEGVPVTEIGDRAFSNRVHLEEVIMPDSITKIGDYAFKNCTNLKNINLPDDLTELSYKSFYNTPKLDASCFPEDLEVCMESRIYTCNLSNEMTQYVPEFVTSMYSDSYIFCEKLYIGSKMKDIIYPEYTDPTIYEFSIKDVFVSEENPYLCAEDGVVYNKDKSEIIYIAPNHKFDNGIMTIPATVEKISCPIYSKNISAYEVESANNSFMSIDGVLYDISGKRLIGYPPAKSTKCFSIPSGTEIISKFAFFNTSSELDFVGIPEGVMTIEQGAFWLTDLEVIVFEHDDTASLNIPIDFHGYYTTYDKLYMPDTLYYAKKGSVIETMFPDNFVEMCSDVSGSCGNDLTWDYKDFVLTIKGSGEMTKCSEGEYPWSNFPCVEVKFEGNDITVSDYAFAQNELLYTLDLTGVTTISNSAFFFCKNLSEITGGDGIRMIKPYGIFNTEWSDSVHDETGMNILGSVLVKYAGTDSTAEIPDNVTYVASGAFSENICDTLYVPEKGVTYSGGAFGNNTSIEHVRFKDMETDVTYDDFKKAAKFCTEKVLIDASGNEITGMTFTSDNSIMSLANTIENTPYMANIYDEYCEKIIMTCSDDMTDQQLIDVIYNYANRNIDYGFTYIESPYGTYQVGDTYYELCAGLTHNPAGIVFMNRGVCSAFAELVNIYASLINETGISGTLISESTTGLNHEWNAIGLNTGTEEERWYYLDLSNRTYLIGYENGIISSNPEMFAYNSGLAKNDDGTYTVTLSSGKVINIQSSDAELAAVKGDVNGDGKVMIDDATAVLTMYAYKAAGIEVTGNTDAADIDGNGSVDITDATSILTYYAQYSAGMDPDWNELAETA